MQKVAFTRFGVGRGQEGAANLGAAEFQVSSKGCEVGALKASSGENSDKMGFSKLWSRVSGLVRGLRVSSLSLSLSRSLFGAF